MLDRVFGRPASPVVLNFLKVLSRHGRLGLLRPIARLVEEARRASAAASPTSRSASPASWPTDIRTEIHDRIAASLGTEPVLHVSVDPDLIAGIWVRVGDRVYDGSVRTQLEHARRAMIDRATEMIETQTRTICDSVDQARCLTSSTSQRTGLTTNRSNHEIQ